MGSERADFALGFQDETSGAAESAASALLRLKASMDDGQSSLKEMASQMRLLKGATTPNAQAIADLQSRIAATKAEVASATAAFVNMGGSSKAVATAQQQLADEQKRIADSAAQARGSIVTEAEAVAAMAAQSQAAAAAAARADQAIKAMATAAALNASKFNYAANSQKAYAKSVTDSVMATFNKKPPPMPSLDGVNKAREAMVAAQKQAEKLTTSMAKVAKPTQDSSASLEEMTALAKGALGPLGGMYERVAQVGKGLGKGGLAGMAIAAAVGIVLLTTALVAGAAKLAVFAVTANKVQMERLNKISEKASENFKKLFSGVHVEKFVDLVEDVAKLLDESSASAAALKQILSTMLNPLFDAFGGAGPLAKNFFRGMVIGALLLTIGILAVKNAIKSMIPPEIAAAISQATGGMNGLRLAVALGIGVFAALAAPIASGFAILLAGAALASTLFQGMAGVFRTVVGVAVAVGRGLSTIGAAAIKAASGLISGLVNGISSGTGAVMSAIRNLAGSTIGAFTAALRIRSPSKVFASLGEFTAEGFAQGVEAGGGTVTGAVEGMASGAVSSAAGAPSKGGSRGGQVVLQLTVQGPPSYQSAVRGAYEQLCETLEAGLNMAGYPVAIEVA